MQSAVRLPILRRACASPTEVVVFPSPAAVGLIAVTSTSSSTRRSLGDARAGSSPCTCRTGPVSSAVEAQLGGHVGNGAKRGTLRDLDVGGKGHAPERERVMEEAEGGGGASALRGRERRGDVSQKTQRPLGGRNVRCSSMSRHPAPLPSRLAPRRRAPASAPRRPVRFACRDAARGRGRGVASRRGVGRRARGAAAHRRSHFLNVTMPLNERYQPASRAVSASSIGPLKQWRTPTMPAWPASRTIAMVSSTASRVCTTTPAARLGRETQLGGEGAPLQRDAANDRSGSRGRTRRRRRRRARGSPRRRGGSASGSNPDASCGCTPAVNQTKPGCAAAIAAARSAAARDSPMQTSAGHRRHAPAR